MSSLLYMSGFGRGVVQISVDMCYCHQLGMISFIELETCCLICCWLCWLLFCVLVFLNLSWKIWWALLWFFLLSYFLGYKEVLLSLCCSCFCDISWVICYLSCWYCFDKQWHLAGNFRGFRGRLCWIFKFLSAFSLGICWCLVSVWQFVSSHW
jgi:hypothetical protein